MRAIITDELTGIQPSQLIDRKSRDDLLGADPQAAQAHHRRACHAVLITDLAVQ